MRRIKTVSEETVVTIELDEEDIEMVLKSHFSSSLPGATSIEVRIDCGQLASAVVSLIKRETKEGL